MTPTKERILRESLALFSERGYSAVRVADIAAAVGVKPPSLYKHYASKQAIFDACAEFFSERVAEVGVAIGLPGSAGAEAAYADVDVEGIVGFATQLFVFYLQDDVAAGFRRMLAIERHRDPKLNREFERLFVDGAIDHEEKVFAELMEAGLIERRDPHILALRFYTPIFYLLQKYDMRPSEVKTAKEELRMIVEEFCSIYMQNLACKMRRRRILAKEWNAHGSLPEERQTCERLMDQRRTRGNLAQINRAKSRPH